MAHQLTTATETANARIPDRDIVITSESAITAAATARSSARLASGDDNQMMRRRQSGWTRPMARATVAHSSPNESGRAISIQPAKWFLLTNGPKGLPGIRGAQKP